jgi:hypothetical protein
VALHARSINTLSLVGRSFAVESRDPKRRLSGKAEAEAAGELPQSVLRLQPTNSGGVSGGRWVTPQLKHVSATCSI